VEKPGCNRQEGVIVEIAVPQAALVWMFLLLAVVVIAAAVALPGFVPEDLPPRPDPADDARYAEEVAVAADRAAATAARRRADWLAAQEEAAVAWAAYEAADAAGRRVAAAAAFPVPCPRRAPTEPADRERHLHRAATAACRRQELSIRQLNEALAHRGGWDPRLHPVEQDAVLARAAVQHRLAGHRAASERERAAWQAAEAAADALRSLRAEARAAVRAGGDLRPAGVSWWAAQWSATEPVAA
jgi:hypothetical protein